MRFHTLHSGRFSSRGAMSTLLLAALCVLLAAPASQGASREDVSAAILTQVLTASVSSAQLSALETRQVRAFIAQLEKTTGSLSLLEIEQELAALSPAVIPPRPDIALSKFSCHTPPHLLHFHEAALLAGVRANSYLE